jgi:nucleotide-binding universal stress UspA family protein
MQMILVPLDGTPQAEEILPTVRMLALAMGVGARLLHVVADPEHLHVHAIADEAAVASGAPASPWQREQQGRWLGERRAAEGHLEHLAAELRAAGVEAACDVQLGPPAATILAAAERHRVVLIALASHGYTGLRRWVAGSIAEQIVQTAHQPALLRRIGAAPAPLGALRRVLVPLDGSVFARYALDHAIAIAHGARAELIVLQTLAPSIEDYLGGAASLIDQRGLLRENVRRAYAARFGDQAAAQATIVAAIGVGGAADALVEEALHQRADLIVLGNPPHAGLSRRAGSLADHVFHRTPTPLLLVHAPIQHG